MRTCEITRMPLGENFFSQSAQPHALWQQCCVCLLLRNICSVLSFGAHKDPNSAPSETNKKTLRLFEIEDGESFEKREHNSLMVTYQYGTSQKVRGQANSLPGPLLRRTKKKVSSLFWLVAKNEQSFFKYVKNVNVSQDRWHESQKSKTIRRSRVRCP